MSNIDLFGNQYDENFITPKGKYQYFRYVYSYRKSNSNKKCKNCINKVLIKHHDKKYHKCKLQGVSHSETSDIRVNNVCDLFNE